MERVKAYVDGFNLYHGLKVKHGRKYLWLDLQALTIRLLNDVSIRNSQLPPSVVNAAGITLTRPKYWT